MRVSEGKFYITDSPVSVIKLQWYSYNYLFYSYFTVHEFVIGSFKHDEKLLQTP